MSAPEPTLPETRWPNRIVVPLLVALATLAGIIHAMQSATAPSRTGWISALPWGLTFSYLMLAVGGGAWQLARWLPIGAPHGLRNTAVHTVVGLGLSALHPFAVISVIALITSPRWCVEVAKSMLPYLHFWYLQTLIIAALVYMISLFAAHATRYYQEYQQGQLRAARLEAQLANANLAALKMQLHPHFLFNALHSISALQVTDAAAAQRMTTLLGDFLRMTLREFDQQQVTLRREMDFLECYLAIEKMRFGDRLTFEFDIPPELMQARLPQLLLQPIVENAIRHGIAPFNAGGNIRVRASRQAQQLSLEVEDSGPGLREPLAGAAVREGLGLTNTRARLAQFCGADHSMTLENLTPTGLRVRFLIPFHAA